jgi:hypothetical protein
VGGLADQLKTCETELRRRLEPGERVVAVGRAEDITLRGTIDAGGAAWTFVMVTDRRLRWVPNCRLRYVTALDLDGVAGALERTSAHRYGIRLRHRTIRAVRRVPKHRILGFEWGSADAVRALDVTTLAFSRRDTKASRALREQLARRGVIPKSVPGPPRPPRPDPRAYRLLRSDDQ